MSDHHQLQSQIFRQHYRFLLAVRLFPDYPSVLEVVVVAGCPSHLEYRRGLEQGVDIVQVTFLLQDE